jgi:hypothetical protein
MLALLPLVACGPTFVSKEEAQAVVEKVFAEQNPPGRTGMALGGKAVWLSAYGFDPTCLEQKDLAFNDNARERHASAEDVMRISPTYAAQRFLTASTAGGYCLYAGDDPQLEIMEIEPETDTWHVTTNVKLARSTPWFDCLDRRFTTRFVDVIDSGDHTAAVKDPSELALFEGKCPHPMPAGEDRPKAHARPTAKPPKAPSMDDVQALVKSFDDALYAHDFVAALSHVSCANLVEEAPFFGACSVGELVSIGPQPRGQERAEDGKPWLEFAVASFDDFQRIVPERKDPTLYHVTMRHKRTGRDRSFGVQWADGKWKLLGVVDSKAEGLTFVRFLYDLHDAARMATFDKRLKGEKLDEKGQPPVGSEEDLAAQE